VKVLRTRDTTSTETIANLTVELDELRAEKKTRDTSEYNASYYRKNLSREAYVCRVCQETSSTDNRTQGTGRSTVYFEAMRLDSYLDQIPQAIRDDVLTTVLKRPPRRDALVHAFHGVPELVTAIRSDTVKVIESRWTAEVGLALRIRCNIPQRKYQYMINILSKEWTADGGYRLTEIYPSVRMPSLKTYASKQATIDLQRELFGTLDVSILWASDILGYR